MPFSHHTFTTDVLMTPVNLFWQLSASRLKSVGLSASHAGFISPCVRFSVGLTPLGDQALQQYMMLASGLLGPGDGLTWIGDIRVTDDIFLSLTWMSFRDIFVYLTWNTG